MREYMTEEQRVILEGELAAFDTGMQFATNRLRVWREGGYDPETEWIRDRGERRRVDRAERRRLEREMNRARQDAIARASGTEPVRDVAPAADVQPESPERVTPPHANSLTDEWDRYVEAFIKRYQLADDQQNSARRFLTAKKEQRHQYLRRKGDQMERIQKLFKQAEGKEKLERAEAEYHKLNEPIERMFAQLKEKLNTLPTRKQRRAAALADGKRGETSGAKRESPSSP